MIPFRPAYALLGILAMGLILTMFAVLSMQSRPQAEQNSRPQPTAPEPTIQPTSLALNAYPTTGPVHPISRSVNGYTITLYPLVADPNRVLITYAIAGLPDRNTAATWLGTGWTDQREFTGPLLSKVLSNGASRVLPSLTTPLYGKVIEGADPRPPDKDYIHVMAFDNGGFKALPAILHLNMTTSLLVNRRAAPTPATRYNPNVEQLANNLDFDFAMPVNPLRRVASVHQTVRVGTVDLTLESVDVTVSETRFNMSARARDSKPRGNWQPDALELQIGSWRGKLENAWEYPRTGLGIKPTLFDGWTTLYPDALLDKEGEWTVTVPSLRWGAYDAWGDDAGPWAFHVTMPPATTLPIATP